MKKEKEEKEGLSDYGIIFLSGDISDGNAETISREIIQYNLNGKAEHIQLIINSCGGSCSAGFAIIDIMEWSRLPVYTTGIGMLASMGLLVFMAGHKGRRVITPRTAILSHRFWGLSWGNHSQLLAARKEQDLVHKRIVEHYLRYSGVKDQQELENTLLQEVDTWLTPEEAVKYGIVDVVEQLGTSANGHAA